MPETPANPDAERLAALEAIVAQGITSFVEVGEALAAIRDGRLYLASHKTFASYLSEKWQMTKSRANQLVGASIVAANLATNVVTPKSEAQVRPLTKLPADDQRAAWQEAVEISDGKPTAKHVEEAVAKRTGKTREPKGETKLAPIQQGDPLYTLMRVRVRLLEDIETARSCQRRGEMAPDQQWKSEGESLALCRTLKRLDLSLSGGDRVRILATSRAGYMETLRARRAKSEA